MLSKASFFVSYSAETVAISSAKLCVFTWSSSTCKERASLLVSSSWAIFSVISPLRFACSTSKPKSFNSSSFFRAASFRVSYCWCWTSSSFSRSNICSFNACSSVSIFSRSVKLPTSVFCASSNISLASSASAFNARYFVELTQRSKSSSSSLSLR